MSVVTDCGFVFVVPPSITRLDQQGDPVQVTEGQISSVTFMVTGNPFPSFMWTENGQMVGNGSGLTAGAFSLMLNPADRQHEGSYQLIVTNSIGSADYNFTLDVLCKIETLIMIYV